MPQTCTICKHADRSQIDAALISGGPLRSIADRFTTSKTSLIRHRDNCISQQLQKAREGSNSAQASALIRRLREITEKTTRVLTRAQLQKNGDLALKAIARLERQLELEARLLGQLEENRGAGGSTTVQVVYVDKQVNLATGTHNSPHSFGARSGKVLEAKAERTCDPLLAEQNQPVSAVNFAKINDRENVLDAPQRDGAAEDM